MDERKVHGGRHPARTKKNPDSPRARLNCRVTTSTLNKRATMSDLIDHLDRAVQEVTKFFPIQSHPTSLLPELREFFFSTLPLEVVERLLPFYHDEELTARAPRRPSLVALLRCTWVYFSADLVARQTKRVREGLQRYVTRDSERVARERLQAERHSLTESSGPPSLGSQSDSA